MSIAPTKRTRVLSTAALALSLVSACSRGEAPASVGVPPAPPGTNGTTASGAQRAVPDAPQPSLRQVIRKAELSLEVDSVADAETRASNGVEQLGGYVTSAVSEEPETRSEPRRATLELRVPAERFTRALAALRALGSGRDVERIDSEDVSEETIDLAARIKNQRVLEERLLEILKRADKVGDALAVERELSSARTEIDRLEARRTFLAREVALSTITLHLIQRQPLASSSLADLKRTGVRAVSDTLNVSAGIVTAAIRLAGVLVPLGLLVGAPCLLLLRSFARRRGRPSGAQLPAPLE